MNYELLPPSLLIRSLRRSSISSDLFLISPETMSESSQSLTGLVRVIVRLFFSGPFGRAIRKVIRIECFKYSGASYHVTSCNMQDMRDKMRPESREGMLGEGTKAERRLFAESQRTRLEGMKNKQTLNRKISRKSNSALVSRRLRTCRI